MGVPFIPVGFLRVCSSAMSMALVCCGTAPLHLGKQPNFFFPKGETAGRFYSTKQIEKTKIRRETIQGVRETNSDDFRECFSPRYKILLWRGKKKKRKTRKKKCFHKTNWTWHCFGDPHTWAPMSNNVNGYAYNNGRFKQAIWICELKTSGVVFSFLGRCCFPSSHK
jgi:hypothetical protein